MVAIILYISMQVKLISIITGVEEHPYILGEGHVPRLFPDFSTMSPALEALKVSGRKPKKAKI